MIQVIQLVTGGWAVFIGIVLLSCSFIMENRADSDKKTFAYRGLLAGSIVYQLSDLIAWKFSGSTSHLSFYMVRVSNFLCYMSMFVILRLLFNVTVFLIREKDINTGRFFIRMQKGFSAVMLVLTITNLFTEWIYSFDEMNRFYLSWHPLMVVYYLSCLLSVILIYGIALRYRSCSNGMLLWRIRMTCILNVLFSAVQIIVYGYPAFSFAMTAGAVLGFTGILKNRADMQHEKQLQLEENRKNLARTKQQMLQLQIQPHFMYNTMAAIQTQILEDQESAFESIGIFSSFLRDTIRLSRLEHQIPVEQELDFAEKYIDLAELRFGEKLNFDFDIKTTEFKVPSLTIQPLLENALNHGLKPFDYEGTICIRTDTVVADGKNIYIIEVEDNGIGIDPEQMQFPPDKSQEHIGVANVIQRIEMACNGKVEMISPVKQSKIGSGMRRGTMIRISIPEENSYDSGN